MNFICTLISIHTWKWCSWKANILYLPSERIPENIHFFSNKQFLLIISEFFWILNSTQQLEKPSSSRELYLDTHNHLSHCLARFPLSDWPQEVMKTKSWSNNTFCIFPFTSVFFFSIFDTERLPKNYSPLFVCLTPRCTQTHFLCVYTRHVYLLYRIKGQRPEYESISCSDSTNRKEYRSRDQSWNFYQSSRFKSHILADPIKLRGGS